MPDQVILDIQDKCIKIGAGDKEIDLNPDKAFKSVQEMHQTKKEQDAAALGYRIGLLVGQIDRTKMIKL